MAPTKASKPPETDDTLKREQAGTYRTRDGRFTIESSSSGWLLYDSEQTDGLGLPLARGPFATLDLAKAALGPARNEPAPAAARPARTLRSVPGGKAAGAAPEAPPASKPAPAARPSASPKPAKAPPRPAIVIREIRTVDGDALRALWKGVGFKSLGDDDRSLARLARRNPGLVLVAAEGSRVIGSALGAWDGRRGWIYHVAVAASHRRQGIARRLVAEIETGLRSLGCPKVNVLVRDDSDGGEDLWHTLGYAPGVARHFGKEL